MNRSSTFALAALTLLLGALTACTTDSEGTDSADVSFDVDMRCAVTVLSNEHVQLSRCGDGAAYGLHWIGGPQLDHIRLELQISGEVFTPADWPVASWTDDGQTARLSLTSHRSLPDAVLVARLDAEAVHLTLTLTAPRELTVSEARPLWSGGELGGLHLAGTDVSTWLSFGVPGEPPVKSQSAPLRPGEQVFFSSGKALYVRAGTPGGQIRPHNDAAADRLGLQITDPNLIRLAPGQPYQIDFTLRGGDDLATLLDTSSSGFSNDPHRLQGAQIGWRSGAAYGYLAHSAAITAAATWLGQTTPPPLLLVDGLWYSAIGQWTPGLAFPNGLPDTPDFSLGLHWPALRSTEADGRQADDEACVAPPCRFVRYGRPETREEIARVANTLSTSGVDSVEIPDVPDQWATALAESMSASGLDLIAATHVPQRGAYTQKLRAVGPASSPPCVHPTSVEQDECRALLSREDPPTALPPPSKDSLIRTAWSLSTGWHHGLSHRLDPGPVHVAGLAQGLARQWATIIAMAGGLYLLGDPVDQLTPQAAETFWAPWEAGLVRLWRPVYQGRQLPTVWRTPGGLALFNWGDEPATIRGLPGLLNEAAEVRSLFDERSFPEGLPDTLDVPPQDVVVLFNPE